MIRPRLTARQLNRATLERQLLLERARVGVLDAVRRVVALQAQEPPSPYVALWNRVADFDPADLDRAFTEHELVKATLMRVTLHAVHADDYPHFHEAMQPTLRAARLHDLRYRRSGLTPADADRLLPEVLGYAAQPRSNADAEAWLDERLGVTPKPGVWWAFRQYGRLVHHPTGGPWSFGPRPAYVAARRLERSGDHERAQAVLARRYLEGFGPASAVDFAQFAFLNRPVARAAFERLRSGIGGLVELEGPGGESLVDLPDTPLPNDDVPAPPRLMAMWDSTLLAYADRSRIIPPEYRKLVIRSNGDVLPTVLVDGHVAGVWRPLDGAIEATAFHALPADAWDGLESEARRLVDFLGTRDRAIYTRYGRWWSELPAVEVRRLGG